MPYAIDWYIPQRVIYLQAWGAFTLEGGKALNDQLTTLLDAGQSPVSLIIDGARTTNLPVSLTQVCLTLNFLRHPALSWMVAHGKPDPVQNYIIPTTARLLGMNLVRVETFDEAVAFLMQQFPDLYKYEINQHRRTVG